MTLRIKWLKRNAEGIQKSAKTFISKSTGARYQITIDRKKVTFKITNLTNRKCYYGGEGISNCEVLGRHIRKKLKSLGVEIEKETRAINNKGN